jgi:hypothetical protein
MQEVAGSNPAAAPARIEGFEKIGGDLHVAEINWWHDLV